MHKCIRRVRWLAGSAAENSREVSASSLAPHPFPLLTAAVDALEITEPILQLSCHCGRISEVSQTTGW